MADITTSIGGVRLRNPFILSSGPLSYSAHALIRAHEAGAGAVVTKTIRLERAVNPVPHMMKNGSVGLINCEKWADIEAKEWIEREIPEAKAHGVTVIGSVGHTLEEARELVKPVADAGADVIELVSYRGEDMVPMVKVAKKATTKPVLAKVSPNWPDVAEVAARCIETGADGITAVDSFGPVLRIDIAAARPLMGSESGLGWMSGPALFPIALRVVADVARRGAPVVVGVGGISKAEDALEMILAGANALGVCSVAILRGLRVFRDLPRTLSELMDKYGYESIQAARGRALPNLPAEEELGRLEFQYDPDVCNECMRCVEGCTYGARSLKDREMKVDEDRCRYCGLCTSLCPTGALTIKGRVPA